MRKLLITYLETTNDGVMILLFEKIKRYFNILNSLYIKQKVISLFGGEGQQF